MDNETILRKILSGLVKPSFDEEWKQFKFFHLKQFKFFHFAHFL